MAPALAAKGIEVDYLFSGRAPEKLFNMEPFGHYRCKRGLTFHMQGSRVDLRRTLLGNHPLQLIRDIYRLDLSRYDLVLTDFEPITAWAAKLRGVPSVGIAHQYAFMHDLPDTHSGFLLRKQVQCFAPANQVVGLHWHSFGQAIFPPLIQPPLYQATTVDQKIVVYLPYDNVNTIQTSLSRYKDAEFYIYAAVEQAKDNNNMHIRPFSRDGFQQDLASCSGVICNSGFGLLSEAMQYGKKILTLPQQGQSEQLSNAELLEYLKKGTVIQALDDNKITDWLQEPMPVAVVFPDLAAVLADWIVSGCDTPLDQLATSLWGEVVPQLP